MYVQRPSRSMRVPTRLYICGASPGFFSRWHDVVVDKNHAVPGRGGAAGNPASYMHVVLGECQSGRHPGVRAQVLGDAGQSGPKEHEAHCCYTPDPQFLRELIAAQLRGHEAKQNF